MNAQPPGCVRERGPMNKAYRHLLLLCILAAMLLPATTAHARYTDGPNLYQYVQSRPTAAVDPMGLEGDVVDELVSSLPDSAQEWLSDLKESWRDYACEKLTDHLDNRRKMKIAVAFAENSELGLDIRLEYVQKSLSKCASNGVFRRWVDNATFAQSGMKDSSSMANSGVFRMAWGARSIEYGNDWANTHGYPEYPRGYGDSTSLKYIARSFIHESTHWARFDVDDGGEYGDLLGFSSGRSNRNSNPMEIGHSVTEDDPANIPWGRLETQMWQSVDVDCLNYELFLNPTMKAQLAALAYLRLGCCPERASVKRRINSVIEKCTSSAKVAVLRGRC